MDSHIRNVEASMVDGKFDPTAGLLQVFKTTLNIYFYETTVAAVSLTHFFFISRAALLVLKKKTKHQPERINRKRNQVRVRNQPPKKAALLVALRPSPKNQLQNRPEPVPKAKIPLPRNQARLRTRMNHHPAQTPLKKKRPPNEHPKKPPNRKKRANVLN